MSPMTTRATSFFLVVLPAKALPTTSTSARGFIGTKSLGAWRLRAGSSFQWSSSSVGYSCSLARGDSVGARRYVALQITVAIGPREDRQVWSAVRTGAIETSSGVVKGDLENGRCPTGTSTPGNVST